MNSGYLSLMLYGLLWLKSVVSNNLSKLIVALSKPFSITGSLVNVINGPAVKSPVSILHFFQADSSLSPKYHFKSETFVSADILASNTTSFGSVIETTGPDAVLVSCANAGTARDTTISNATISATAFPSLPTFLLFMF